MSKFVEYLGLVEELHQECEAAFAVLPSNTKGVITMTLASLYASIFSFADSALYLLRNQREAGVSAIGRSTLEALVDLKNLVADDAYMDRMEASFYKEYLKMLEDGVTGSNPYSIGFANNASVAQGVADFKNRLAILKSKGVVPLSIRQKFDNVEMTDLYMAVYNQLCAEGHNNLRALNERHIEFSDREFNVIVFKEQRESHLLTLLDLFADPLLIGLAEIYRHQKIPLPDNFLKVEKKIISFRASL
jgi:Family of unknown function (DUF5677)